MGSSKGGRSDPSGADDKFEHASQHASLESLLAEHCTGAAEALVASIRGRRRDREADAPPQARDWETGHAAISRAIATVSETDASPARVVPAREPVRH